MVSVRKNCHFKKCFPKKSLDTALSYDCHLWCKCVKWQYLQVFFTNFKILIFQAVRGLKGHKMTKISVCYTLYFRNHISYDIYLGYTIMYERIISPCIVFIFLFKFWFLESSVGGAGGWGVGGGKRTKNSICPPPYLNIIEILIMISTGVFFYFFKMQSCKYYNYFVFLLAHFNNFLIIICFSSSLINAKKKFWGFPYLLHICVIFTICFSFFGFIGSHPKVREISFFHGFIKSHLGV